MRGQGITGLTYVSICAGAGLGSLGFDRAGWTGTAVVEWSPTRRSILRYHHPDAQHFGDLRQLSSEQLPRACAWLVTVPCTSYSGAGKREGLNHPNDLHRPFFRLLAQAIKAGVAPDVIVWENVDAWITYHAARLTKRALGCFGFREAMGGHMNAREFGVPQDRKRALAVFARDRRYVPERIPTPHTMGEREVLLKSWPDAFIECELTETERLSIAPRVVNRVGQEKREELKRESRQFAGLEPPPAEWDGFCIFHCDSMRTSFQIGFCPTICASARLIVRRPDARLFKVNADGYEWLMGLGKGIGYTARGIDDRGRLVDISKSARKQACGLGIVTPIMEAIARALPCTGEEKKS